MHTNQVSFIGFHFNFYKLNFLPTFFFRLLVAHTSLYLPSSALLVLRLLLLCFLCGLCTDARSGEQFESGIPDWWIHSDILSVTLAISGAPHLPVPQIEDHHLSVWHLHHSFHYSGCDTCGLPLCGEDSSAAVLCRGKFAEDTLLQIVYLHYLLSHFKHTTRTFHNGDAASSINHTDSGFYVLPVDRHPDSVDSILFENTNYTKADRSECETEIMCGYPIYSSRWVKAK